MTPVLSVNVAIGDDASQWLRQRSRDEVLTGSKRSSESYIPLTCLTPNCLRSASDGEQDLSMSGEREPSSNATLSAPPERLVLP